MEGVLVDYHIIFIMMAFILLVITAFLLFIEPTVETTAAAYIFIMINMVLCIFCSLSFYGLDLVGYDSAGEVVHNTYYEMQTFSFLFVGFFYVNIMLMVYGAYLFYKKPWEEFVKENKDWLESRGGGGWDRY